MLIARLPQNLPQCPGGIGLTTAMTMLKSGWIIVGSTPSRDGTTRTRGEGCLLVLNPEGQVAAAWTGPDISGPWGNIASVDNGSTATMFVSMAGFRSARPGCARPGDRRPRGIQQGHGAAAATLHPAGPAARRLCNGPSSPAASPTGRTRTCS